MSSSFYSQEELSDLGFKSVGKNVLISKKASLYGCSNMVIGSNVRVDDFAILSGKIVIGNHVHIAAYTSLFAGEYGIYLEDFTGISSHSTVYAVTDDYSGEALTNPTIPEEFRKVTGGKVILQKHALIGAGSCILPAVTIGEGTSVGSMSLINRSLDGWGVYAGIPCKRIKERSKKVLELEEELLHGNKIFME